MLYNNSYSGLIGTLCAYIQKISSFRTSIYCFFVTAMLLYGSQSFAQTIVVVDDFERISNPQESSIKMKLYPNPAHDKVLVEIDGAEQIRALKVLDLSGREIKIFNPKFLGKSYRLNVLNLPAGTYILRIQTENGAISKKLSMARR